MSGRKNIIESYLILNAQSLGATFQSAAVDISHLDRVCVELQATTSDAVGTFSLQGSISGSVWTDLQMDAMPIASLNKNFFIDIQQTAIKQIRINYTRTSGTGTVTAYLTAKEA